MKESKFQSIVINTLNTLDNCFCFKNEIKYYGSGKPDLTIIYNGKAILCELKIGRNKITVLQEAYMRKALIKDVICCVITLNDNTKRYDYKVLKECIVKIIKQLSYKKENKIYYISIKGGIIQ